MRSSVPAQSNSRPTPTWLKDLNTEPTQPQGNRADKHNKKEALYPGMYLEPRYRLSAAAYFQLLQNLMHVVLNRGGTNCELTGNIFVGQPCWTRARTSCSRNVREGGASGR